MKLVRRLKNFFRPAPKSPEEEAARAESMRARKESKRQAFTGHGRYESRR